MAEGLGSEVELTLLVGHKTGCSEEARPKTRYSMSQKAP